MEIPNVEYIRGVIHGRKANLIARDAHSESKRRALARID
jgi:hypothetical protein